MIEKKSIGEMQQGLVQSLCCIYCCFICRLGHGKYTPDNEDSEGQDHNDQQKQPHSLPSWTIGIIVHS